MNINSNEENRGENQEKLSPLKGFWWVIRSLLHFRTNFHGCQFGQRDHLNAVKHCPQQLTYLHDVKSHCLRAHPLCDTKNWDALTKIPIPYQ